MATVILRQDYGGKGTSSKTKMILQQSRCKTMMAWIRDSEMFNYIIFGRQNQQGVEIFVRYGMKKKVRNQR